MNTDLGVIAVPSIPPVLDPHRRRVCVTFPSVGIRLSYQCDLAAAEAFARHMRAHPYAHVAVDCDLQPELPLLPCLQLWSDRLARPVRPNAHPHTPGDPS